MLLSIKLAHQGRLRRLHLAREDLEGENALVRLKTILGLEEGTTLLCNSHAASRFGEHARKGLPIYQELEDDESLRNVVQASTGAGESMLRLEVPLSEEERRRVLEESFVHIPSSATFAGEQADDEGEGGRRERGRCSIERWRRVLESKIEPAEQPDAED